MTKKSKVIKILGAIMLIFFCQKDVSATESVTDDSDKEVSADMAPDLASLEDSSTRIAKSALRRQSLISDAANRLTGLVDTTSSLMDAAEEKLEGYLSRASAYLPSRDTLLSVGITGMAGGLWVAGNMWSERRYVDVYKVSVVKKEEPIPGAWERLETARTVKDEAELAYKAASNSPAKRLVGWGSEGFSKWKAAERRYTGIYFNDPRIREIETEVREKIGTTLTMPSFRESLPSDMKLASGLATGLISGIRLGLAYMKKKEFIAEVGVPAATGATAAAAGSFAASAAAAAGQVALATQHATFAAGAIPAAFLGAEIASQATSLAQSQLCHASLAEASQLISHRSRELTDLSDSSSQVDLFGEFQQAVASKGGGSPISPEWDLTNFWASSWKSLLLKIHLSKVNARGVKVRFIGSLLKIVAWASLAYGDLLLKWLKNLGAPLLTLLPIAGLQEKSVGVPAVKKESASSGFCDTPKTTKEQKKEEPKKLPIGWLVVALTSILAALAAFSKKKK